MVRKARRYERADLLQGDFGFVAEEGGAIVGHVAWNIQGGKFYIHSLLVMGGDSFTAARLVQRAKAEAKRQGYDSLFFHVEEPNLGLLNLAASGKAAIVSAVLRLELNRT